VSIIDIFKLQLTERMFVFRFLNYNSWPTFSPYLYNRVQSEWTCCNSLAWLVHAWVVTSSHPSVFISHYHGHELW